MSRNGLKAGRKIRRCNPPERESGCKLARWLTPRTRPNGSIGRCRVPTYFVSTTSARSARAGSPSRNTAPTSSSGGETGRFRPRSNRWYGATRLASRSSPSGDERGVTLAQGIAGRLPPMTRTPRVTNHTVALPRTGADRAPRCRASDVPKPACPWCGASTSAVYLSRADLAKNVYRRRRRCDEYRRQWPTVEDLDRDRFARELRALGLTLDDLGSSSTAGAHGGRAPHG